MSNVPASVSRPDAPPNQATPDRILQRLDWQVIRQAFRFGTFEMLGSVAWAVGQALEVDGGAVACQGLLHGVAVDLEASYLRFEGRGIDFRRDDIELWPTEYQLCGGHGISGVLINRKAQTATPGLFAAGDVACVPGQHLSGAFDIDHAALMERGHVLVL